MYLTYMKLSLHLEHDNNIASSDTREFSRVAQHYNMQTVLMSRDMLKLNRKSTEAAEATTNTTRINVQVGAIQSFTCRFSLISLAVPHHNALLFGTAVFRCRTRYLLV